MEEEEIEQFSEEEVAIEIQDPYQQWFNKREFSESDRMEADKIM